MCYVCMCLCVFFAVPQTPPKMLSQCNSQSFCFSEVYYEVVGKWLRFLHKCSFSLAPSCSVVCFLLLLASHVAVCSLASCHILFALIRMGISCCIKFKDVCNFSVLPLLHLKMATFHPCTISHTFFK